MSKTTIRAFWGYELQPAVYHFDTKAEAVAFAMGVSACDGWSKHYLTDGDGDRWIVQENTVCDGWINNWAVDGEPQIFDSYEAAEAELEDLLETVREAVKRGDMSEEYDRDNFRIIPIDLED